MREGEDSVLTIKINNMPPSAQTKLIGAELDNTQLCQTIRGLDIFVFDYDTERLENYERYSDAWKGGGAFVNTNSVITQREFELSVKRGRKKIVIIANSQHTQNELFSYFGSFRDQTNTPPKSFIYKEYPGAYTLYWVSDGAVEIGEGGAHVSAELSRVVSRLVIRSFYSASNTSLTMKLENYCQYVSVTTNGVERDIIALGVSPLPLYYGTGVFAQDNSANHGMVQAQVSLNANIVNSTAEFLFFYPRMAGDNYGGQKTTLKITGNGRTHSIVFNEIAENTSYEIDRLTINSTGGQYTISQIATTKSTDSWNVASLGTVEL